jgi:hypothetical protein
MGDSVIFYSRKENFRETSEEDRYCSAQQIAQKKVIRGKDRYTFEQDFSEVNVRGPKNDSILRKMSAVSFR